MRRRLRFIGKFYVNTADGRKFKLFNNAFHLENHIFWLGLDQYPWERMTRRIWVKLSQLSDTIFDIGANSGIYAVLAKVYNERSLVVAFEPQPNVFKILEKNNHINGFNIHCEQLALSDREGRLPFYNYGANTFTTENTTAGSLNKEWVKRDQRSIMVGVMKLESYIEENTIPGIDLMKIDVETLEYEVLNGYRKYLCKHRPVIILEIQNRAIGRRIKSLFDNDQYIYFNIDEQAGLSRVSHLGESSTNLNYLLCPRSKEEHIVEFLGTRQTY
jgi:FkbM family methyltransferase